MPQVGRSGTPRSVTFPSTPDGATVLGGAAADGYADPEDAAPGEEQTPIQLAKSRYNNQWQFLSQAERKTAVAAVVQSEKAVTSEQAQLLSDATLERPKTISGYLQSRGLDVHSTLAMARPDQSTSALLLQDLDDMEPSEFGQDDDAMRGMLLGGTSAAPGLPAWSASTLRQAERSGRPIEVSVHDAQYNGRDLTMQEHTQAGTHSLSALTGSAQAQLGGDYDHEHSRAVDGYWGGTLDPVARLRAAAELSDLTTMKEALQAEERRQRLPSSAPTEYADPVQLQQAVANLQAAIQQVQSVYRDERSLRRNGQSTGSHLTPRDSMHEASRSASAFDGSPSLRPKPTRSRKAQGDPGPLDYETDPAAADIAARRR